MNDAISKTFFLKFDTSNCKKSRSFNKDLFSQKLGQTLKFNSSLRKNRLPSLKISKFTYINNFPKNHTNIFLSSEKDDEISNIIINKLNIPFFPQKEKIWNIENNKQMTKNQSLINTYNSTKYNKKQIKEILNLKQKQSIKDKKSDKTSDKLNHSKEQEKQKSMIQIENTNTQKILEAISHINIQKKLNKKESSKEILEGYKKIENKNKSLKRNKSKNKSKETMSISIVSINKDKNKEDKNSIIFLTNFYEDFIELVNSYDSMEKYNTSVNNFNQTYFFLFDIKSFPKTTMNIQFLNTFKYCAILVICLIFLSKDKKLYNDSVTKIKELLEQFLFVCINSINYKIFETEKFKNFIKNKTPNENKTLIEILNNIIGILFNEKMDDYKKLRKCLRQLANNIDKDTPEIILNIVNNCLLYCHNCNYYLEESDYKRKKKKKHSNRSNNIKKENKESSKDEEKSVGNMTQGPFIKNKMEKKFCLVLDLDETLMHNLNLPFGDYFFVRPGLFDFLEKIHDIYEIIIFTAGKKNYAYSILDKIDYNNYISNILYKKHISYEEGVAVKKLDLIGRDLNKLIFVDNLETCAKYNKKNFYCICSWYNNIYDNELYKLQEKLIYIATSGKYDDDITKGLIEK